MSHLLIQMAQEMSRTGGQGAGDFSQVSRQGSTSEGRKEMKMDEKMDSIDANSILEELDIERKGIVRIQELAGALFRLAMPDS